MIERETAQLGNEPLVHVGQVDFDAEGIFAGFRYDYQVPLLSW